MKKIPVQKHYDLLIQEGNDPVNDPPVLQEYMNKWDGQPFIDALTLNPEDNVLEIGVGTGRLAKKVLETGCGHFTGIDISSATIARAEENLSSWVNKSLICGDFIGCNLNQTFDIIYCSLTLFHFKDKRAFFQKAAGLLRAKGRMVISVPKEKQVSIDFGTREVALYPDDIDDIKVLIAGFGLVVSAVIEVDFANILLAQKS